MSAKDERRPMGWWAHVATTVIGTVLTVTVGAVAFSFTLGSEYSAMMAERAQAAKERAANTAKNEQQEIRITILEQKLDYLVAGVDEIKRALGRGIR